MKIGILGGSFNPVHNGHLKIAQKCLDNKIVDEVWFVPCNHHSFDKSLINIEDRIKMLNLALANYTHFKVDDIESRRGGRSYTIDTLRELKSKYNHEFYMIIGSDNIPAMPKWRDYLDLVNEFEFIITKRPGYNYQDTALLRVKAFVEINESESSTEVRKLLLEGKSIDHLVPQKVAEYIKLNNLYAR